MVPSSTHPAKILPGGQQQWQPEGVKHDHGEGYQWSLEIYLNRKEIINENRNRNQNMNKILFKIEIEMELKLIIEIDIKTFTDNLSLNGAWHCI